MAKGMLDEFEVIQNQARTPQLQIRPDHLPRVQSRPGRVVAVAAAVGVDGEVSRIDSLCGGGNEVLEHRCLHAGADFRIGDAVNPIELGIGGVGSAQPRGRQIQPGARCQSETRGSKSLQE